ncbi:MAG: hypothetical protein ACTHM1_05245 [Solirubrobacteraceae bacterium]
MTTLPAGLVPYLRDYAYTTLSGVAAEIADISGSGNNARRADALAEVRPYFDATIALLDALGWTDAESPTDVTLDAQSAWAIREAVATAMSVEYDRLHEFDSLDRTRKGTQERREVVKRLSDLRKLKEAIDREPPAATPSPTDG